MSHLFVPHFSVKCPARSLLMALLAMALSTCSLTWGGESKPKADNTAPPAVSDAEIAKLIAQLDAAEYADREAATQKLATLGKAAIPALVKAASGKSLEVASRSISALAKLLDSPDEPTKKAAKEGMQSVAQSDSPSAAFRARAALQAREPQRAGVPVSASITGAMGRGRIIVAAVPAPAAGGAMKSMSVSNVNGVKTINVTENEKKIKIQDDPQNGIKIEITQKKDGKDVTDKYEAKNAEELKKQHPEGYKVYKEYAEGQQNNAGVLRVQVGALQVLPGGAVPVPMQGGNARAVPLGNIPAGTAAPVEIAAAMIKALNAQIQVLSRDGNYKNASPKVKADLKKQIKQLKKQLAEVEAGLDNK